MYKIIIIAVITAIFAHMLKKDNPAAAVFLSVSAAVLIFVSVLPQMTGIISTLNQLGAQSGVNSEYIIIILKTIGISYISEFGAQICADAQEASLAQSVELAGRVSIMAVSTPIIMSMVNYIIKL